mmetsp:Transcript_11801/g.39242  ORF Transcript_11801/g.39242 Transcript_11801/m.39242 type:complete len:302 (+) Transcript_11801:772-1677(+)
MRFNFTPYMSSSFRTKLVSSFRSTPSAEFAVSAASSRESFAARRARFPCTTLCTSSRETESMPVSSFCFFFAAGETTAVVAGLVDADWVDEPSSTEASSIACAEVSPAKDDDDVFVSVPNSVSCFAFSTERSSSSCFALSKRNASSSIARSAFSSLISSSSCARNSSFRDTCSDRDEASARSSVTEITTSSGSEPRVSPMSFIAAPRRSFAASSSVAASLQDTSPAPDTAVAASPTRSSAVIVNALDNTNSDGGSFAFRDNSSQSLMCRSSKDRSVVSARIPRAREMLCNSANDKEAKPSL